MKLQTLFFLLLFTCMYMTLAQGQWVPFMDVFVVRDIGAVWVEGVRSTQHLTAAVFLTKPSFPIMGINGSKLLTRCAKFNLPRYVVMGLISSEVCKRCIFPVEKCIRAERLEWWDNRFSIIRHMLRIQKLQLEELQRIKHKKQTQLSEQYYGSSEMFLNGTTGYILLKSCMK